jgi:RIO kinase 1
MPKISHERWKVWGNVFDEFTLRTIFKLGSEGHFLDLESPVAIGKESNVFTAKTKEGKIIVKIYRLESCDFNRMYDYIKGDPRYSGLKKQRRKIIFAWTQREFRNLMKAREKEVRCPTPIDFKNNVLLLEYIGDEAPAPKLKDLYPEDPKGFFEDIIKNYSRLYKAGLVHADLSAFNILNHKERPFFIDFSQCTSIEDSRAEEFLERDIRNVCNFFKKNGMKVDEAETKKKIKEK